MKKIGGLKKRKKSNKGPYQPHLLLSIGLDSPAATMNLGGQLVAQKLPRLWLLRGEVGAGKTTLVRGVLRGLGVRRRVTSPTFGLVRIYPVRHGSIRRVAHVDAYRIKNRYEISALDLESVLRDKKNLVLIEWPERLQKKLPGPATLIHLKHRENSRWVRLKLR